MNEMWMNDMWVNVTFGARLALLAFAFLGGYFVTARMMQPLKKAFLQAGFVRPNFQGQAIPVGMGSALWLGLFFTSAVLLVGSLVWPLPSSIVDALTGGLLVGTGLFVIGLLDDAVGNREATGLLGHLRKLIREREMTTGLLKAITGVVSGGLGAWFIGATGWSLALDTLVIALSANSVNLLDLRPGRACKGVLFALLLLAIVSVHGLHSPLYWLLLGITIAYFPDDVKARTMMGDAGSNLLGGCLGLLVVTTCTPTATLAWGGGLLLLHLYAEKYSLSETIEKNRLLRWLDVLGRSA